MGALLRIYGEVACSLRVVLHFDHVWVLQTATLLVPGVSAVEVLSFFLFEQKLALKYRPFRLFVGSGHWAVFVYKVVLCVLVRGRRWSLSLHAHSAISPSSIGRVNCARSASALGEHSIFGITCELTKGGLLISRVDAFWDFVSDLRLNRFVEELRYVLFIGRRFWWFSVVGTFGEAGDNDVFQKSSVFRLSFSE